MLVLFVSVLLLGVGVPPYQAVRVVAQEPASGDLPVIDTEMLHRIDNIRRAWTECRWEDAFLELLLLSGPVRELANPDHQFSPRISFSEQARDRCWRHLRDRLAVLDRPGGALQMAAIYPRLQRIPIVCTAVGLDPPHNVRQILERWRRNIERRADCDDAFYRAEQLLLAGEEVSAVALLDPLVLKYPSDHILADDVASLRERLIDRTHSELQQACDREDPSSVLQLARRLEAICPEDPQVEPMRQWAREYLNDSASQMLDSKQAGSALLQLALLLEEGEPVAEKLKKLRDRVGRPMRPRIVRDHLLIRTEPSHVPLLIPGIPIITSEKKLEVRSPSVYFGEVGRRWTRSPAHIADVKRWKLLIEEIQQLAVLWLHAPPQEAILISMRLSFHGSEALRIARRLSESAGRRSRGVWQEWAPVYSGERWRVTGSLPVWLIDEKGRELGQSIEIHIDLSPSDPGRDGLPVNQAEIEGAAQSILGSFDRELEKLATQLARRRLHATLQEARRVADSGDLLAAQELLIPALIGSQEHDQDLQQQATVELVRWSQLGVRAVRVATGRSVSP